MDNVFMMNCEYKCGMRAAMSSAHWLNMTVLFVALCVASSWFSLAHAHKILFIGNSFTGYAKPVLEEIAQLNPSGSDQLRFAFRGGISLSEHAHRQETLQTLTSESWDVVVIQDHSLQPIRDPKGFESSVTEWVARIRSLGAEPVLFMTWARREGNGFASQQRQVSLAYRELGNRLSVEVARVGDVWLEMHRTSPEVYERLHQEDAIHATALGSWAAAVSIYATICKTPVAWVLGSKASPAEQAIYQAALRLNTATTKSLVRSECDETTE